MGNSVTTISGATRAIKIKQIASQIPSTIANFPLWFKLGLLTDTKYSEWWNTASLSGNIGIVDAYNELEVNRYIDSNYNNTSKTGSLWIDGSAEASKEYLLQTGATVSKSNNSYPFTNSNILTSHGFLESSGNPVDRCGNYNGTSANIESYSNVAQLDLSYAFNGNNSTITLGQIFSAVNKFSITILSKQDVLDQTDVLMRQIVNSSNVVAIQTSTTGDLNILIRNASATSRGYFDYSSVVTAGQWFLLSIDYDGTQSTNADRLKCYVDGNPVTLSFASTIPTSLPDLSSVNATYGETASSWDGQIDEARIIIGYTKDSDFHTVEYNNFFNTFWDITVQPIIATQEYIGNNRYRIIGTGFKPESVDPVVMTGGLLANVISATDTQLIVEENTHTYGGDQILRVTNSDNEYDTINIISYKKIRYFANYIPLNLQDYLGNPYTGDITKSSVSIEITESNVGGTEYFDVPIVATDTNRLQFVEGEWRLYFYVEGFFNDIQAKLKYRYITISTTEIDEFYTPKDLEAEVTDLSPTALFTINNSSYPVNIDIQFTDESTGNPSSWIWDFGDGQYSYLQNPTHRYSIVKQYTVSLVAINEYGSSNASGTINIVVNDSLLDLSGTGTTEILWLKPNWEFLPKRDWDHNDEVYQYGEGITRIHNISNHLAHIYKAQWTQMTKADEYSIIEFFVSRKGRYENFWLPHWKNLYKLYEPAYRWSTQLRVYHGFFADTFQGYERIFFELKDGSHITRHVVSVINNNDGTETFNIESVLDRDIALADVEYFGKIVLTRFDQDEIEFKHHTSDFSDCDMMSSFLEITEEYTPATGQS